MERDGAGDAAVDRSAPAATPPVRVRRRVESLVFIGALVALLAAVAWWQGGAERVAEGLGSAASLAWGVLPNVVLGFAAAGLVATVIPADLIGRLLGEGSGFRGLLVATVAGVLTPGGPYLQFPLVAALARGGAGPGALAAYLSAWSLVSLNRMIVWELPLLGTPFTVARWAISLAVPLLVGIAVPLLLRVTAR